MLFLNPIHHAINRLAFDRYDSRGLGVVRVKDLPYVLRAVGADAACLPDPGQSVEQTVVCLTEVIAAMGLCGRGYSGSSQGQLCFDELCAAVEGLATSLVVCPTFRSPCRCCRRAFDAATAQRRSCPDCEGVEGHCWLECTACRHVFASGDDQVKQCSSCIAKGGRVTSGGMLTCGIAKGAGTWFISFVMLSLLRSCSLASFPN